MTKYSRLTRIKYSALKITSETKLYIYLIRGYIRKFLFVNCFWADAERMSVCHGFSEIFPLFILAFSLYFRSSLRRCIIVLVCRCANKGRSYIVNVVICIATSNIDCVIHYNVTRRRRCDCRIDLAWLTLNHIGSNYWLYNCNIHASIEECK